MDAAGWAHDGLVDMLVVTPFWATAETDIPVETWRRMLRGTRTLLAAGLELLLRPYPAYPSHPTNSLETVRGAAATFLHQGADRVYLFNYMDSQTVMEDAQNYPALLRECGELATLAGRRRRHVVTYADTWAPGEARGHLLPASLGQGAWGEFRVPIGPAPSGASVAVRLAVDGAAPEAVSTWSVRLNGEPCRAVGRDAEEKPWPVHPVIRFDAPPSAPHPGRNLVEVQSATPGTIHWVELVVEFRGHHT
jgi:hypothetical protein